MAKWVERYKREGPAGLQDRSSQPLDSPADAASIVDHIKSCVASG